MKLSSGTRNLSDKTKNNVNELDICGIIRTCAKFHVSQFCLGDLKIEFRDQKPVLKQEIWGPTLNLPDPLESPKQTDLFGEGNQETIPTQKPKPEIDDDDMSQLALLNPELWEQKLLEGEQNERV